MIRLRFKYKIGDCFVYKNIYAPMRPRILTIVSLDEARPVPGYFFEHSIISVAEEYIDIFLSPANFYDTPLWRKLEGLDD